MRGAPLPTGKADIRLLMKQLPESNAEPKWRGRAETWLTHSLFLFFTRSLWTVVCWRACCWSSGKPSFFPSWIELSILSLRLFPNVPVLSLYLFCYRKQQLLSDASTYSLPSPFELPGLCVFPPSSLISIVRIAAAAELKKKKKKCIQLAAIVACTTGDEDVVLEYNRRKWIPYSKTSFIVKEFALLGHTHETQTT